MKYRIVISKEGTKKVYCEEVEGKEYKTTEDGRYILIKIGKAVWIMVKEDITSLNLIRVEEGKK